MSSQLNSTAQVSMIKLKTERHTTIMYVIATLIMMMPPALSFTDVCENIIDIQKILLESDYEISVSLHDVIFLRKRICQKTNEERQLLEDKQKVVKEFNDIFARLHQEIHECEVNKTVFQVFSNFIRTNFASNFLPLILAVIIFLMRTKGSSVLLPVLSVLLLSGGAFLLITGSSCSEDHLKIWSLYSDTVQIISNVSVESSKHLNHSLQPLHNGLSYNNKEENIWGNWLMRYLKLFAKECFKLMFVRVE